MSGSDTLALRYAGERADDTSASTLDRAIGSALQRQSSRNRYQSVVGTGADMVAHPAERDVRLLRQLPESDRPGGSRSPADVSGLQDGSSFRVPQGTDQGVPAVGYRDAGEGRPPFTPEVSGSAWMRRSISTSSARGGEFVEDFASFDHNGDGRVDDGDLLFAVTLRSGKPDRDLVIPDADNQYLGLRPGRLAAAAGPDAQSGPAL